MSTPTSPEARRVELEAALARTRARIAATGTDPTLVVVPKFFPAVDAATLERTFLSEPVYSGRYANGFGTVFTTIYRPATGTVKVRWLKGVAETWDFESAPPRPIRVYYREGSSRAFRREANRTTARHVTTDREANLEGVASTSREGGTRQ